MRPRILLRFRTARSFPRFPLIAAAALLLGLSACSKAQIREERYPSGALKSQAAFLRLSGDTEVRHGLRVEWYPSGRKSSLETWVHGYLQGYSMRWHPNGRMESVEHFTDGVRDGQSKVWDEAGNLIACTAHDAGDCRQDLADAQSWQPPKAERPWWRFW